MATKYECDACKRQFNDRDNMGVVRFPRMYEDSSNRTQYERELCNSCIDKLLAFLDTMMSKANVS